MNMTTLTTKKLKEVTTKIGSGATPRGGKGAYHKEGIPLIRSLNIYDLNFSYDDLAFIDETQAEQLANVTVEKDDVLLNITGASVCRCTSVPDNLVPARVNQHVSIIRADKKNLLGKYLKYALVSPSYKQLLYGLATTGATREALTKIDIENFEIKLPDIETQTRIASVLSAYDDLIENNEKRIKALEEMAQLLYIEWFVKFKFPGHEKVKMVDSGTEYGMIPEGWEVVGMRSITKIIDCLHTKKPEQIETGNNLLLQLNNILDNGMIDYSSNYFISDEDYTKWTSNIELREGDCVVTNVGRIAASAQIPHGVTAAAGRNMTVIRPEKIPDSFLIQYLHSMHMEREVAKKTDAGAIMGSLNVKNIYLLKVLIPKDSLLESFSNSVSIWRSEMNTLHKENFILSKTRDLLIPQLVTGKRELK